MNDKQENKKIYMDIPKLRKEAKENSSFQVEALLKAMDNNTNESILELNKQKIKQLKNDVLQQLQLSREVLRSFHEKLKDYRYVADLHDLKYGAYIRWIPLKDPSIIKLTNGGIVTDIKMTKTCILIVCKNTLNRIFQIKFDECLIFQKLTEQEHILLDVMDYLQTPNSNSNSTRS